MLLVSPPFNGTSSSIRCLPLVRAMVKVWKRDVGLVMVNFTVSPGVKSTVDGAKKKLFTLTVVSFTSGSSGVAVGVGVGIEVGLGVVPGTGVAVGVAGGLSVGVDVAVGVGLDVSPGA